MKNYYAVVLGVESRTFKASNKKDAIDYLLSIYPSGHIVGIIDDITGEDIFEKWKTDQETESMQRGVYETYTGMMDGSVALTDCNLKVIMDHLLKPPTQKERVRRRDGIWYHYRTA